MSKPRLDLHGTGPVVALDLEPTQEGEADQDATLDQWGGSDG